MIDVDIVYSYYSYYSYCAWNINGLSSKYLGNKLDNTDFLSVINNSDFILLTEIGNCSNLEIEGIQIFFSMSHTKSVGERWA